MKTRYVFDGFIKRDNLSKKDIETFKNFSVGIFLLMSFVTISTLVLGLSLKKSDVWYVTSILALIFIILNLIISICCLFAFYTIKFKKIQIKEI